MTWKLIWKARDQKVENSKKCKVCEKYREICRKKGKNSSNKQMLLDHNKNLRETLKKNRQIKTFQQNIHYFPVISQKGWKFQKLI